MKIKIIVSVFLVMLVVVLSWQWFQQAKAGVNVETSKEIGELKTM